MAGSQLCPNCGMSVGINEDTCDTCRMYETGRSDARLYPILGLIACWALIPIFTGLLLSYLGSSESSLRSRRPGKIAKPVITNVEAPTTIQLGEWAILRLEVNNPGPACFGQMRLAFPTLKGKSDGERIRVLSCSEGSHPGVTLAPVNAPLQNKDGKPVLTQHWKATFSDFAWIRNETNVIQVKVRPRRKGLFTFRYSATFGTPSGLWREAAGSESGPDGEGWFYSARTIDVRPANN